MNKIEQFKIAQGIEKVKLAREIKALKPLDKIRLMRTQKDKMEDIPMVSNITKMKMLLKAVAKKKIEEPGGVYIYPKGGVTRILATDSKRMVYTTIDSKTDKGYMTYADELKEIVKLKNIGSITISEDKLQIDGKSYGLVQETPPEFGEKLIDIKTTHRIRIDKLLPLIKKAEAFTNVLILEITKDEMILKSEKDSLIKITAKIKNETGATGLPQITFNTKFITEFVGTEKKVEMGVKNNGTMDMITLSFNNIETIFAPIIGGAGYEEENNQEAKSCAIITSDTLKQIAKDFDKVCDTGDPANMTSHLKFSNVGNGLKVQGTDFEVYKTKTYQIKKIKDFGFTINAKEITSFIRKLQTKQDIEILETDTGTILKDKEFEAEFPFYSVSEYPEFPAFSKEVIAVDINRQKAINIARKIAPKRHGSFSLTGVLLNDIKKDFTIGATDTKSLFFYGDHPRKERDKKKDIIIPASPMSSIKNIETIGRNKGDRKITLNKNTIIVTISGDFPILHRIFSDSIKKYFLIDINTIKEWEKNSRDTDYVSGEVGNELHLTINKEQLPAIKSFLTEVGGKVEVGQEASFSPINFRSGKKWHLVVMPHIIKGTK